jgi:hypothetical protein
MNGTIYTTALLFATACQAPKTHARVRDAGVNPTSSLESNQSFSSDSGVTLSSLLGIKESEIEAMEIKAIDYDSMPVAKSFDTAGPKGKTVKLCANYLNSTCGSQRERRVKVLHQK